MMNNRPPYCSSRSYKEVPAYYYFRQERPLEECAYKEQQNSQAMHDAEGLEKCTNRFIEKKGENEKRTPLKEFEETMSFHLRNNLVETSPEDEEIPLSPAPPISLRTLLENEITAKSDPPERASHPSKYNDIAQKFKEMDRLYRYEKALRAAEYAAYRVPPEYVEEAALAGAKDFVTNMTMSREEHEESDTIIELISYMGITKPK